MGRWILVLALAGCGVNPTESDADRPAASVQRAGAEPVVSVALLPSSEAGATAAGGGALVVEDGCLWMRSPGGGRASLAFATPSTDWDAGAGLLRVGDKSFAPGAAIRIGGAVFEGKLPRLAWARAPRAECLSAPLWIVSSIE